MPTTNELHAQLEALRHEVESLRAQLAERSTASHPGSPPASPPGSPPASAPAALSSSAAEGRRTRRNLLKLSAAGLGGVGLAQMAVAPAWAGNGDPVVIGSNSQLGTQATGVAVTGNAAAYGLAFTDNGLNTVPLPAALLGHAKGWGGATNWSTGVLGFAEQSAFYGVVGDSVRCGVYGIARGPADNGWPGVLGRGNGDGVTGEGGVVGVRGFGSGSDAVGVMGVTSELTAPALRATGESGLLRLDGAQAAPPSAGSYERGDVLNDKNGSGVWVCVTGGTPGVWRKVAGAGSAGAYHPLDGVRAYDSRQGGGKLGARKTRTIAIPGSIAPSGTTAIHYVLTAVATSGKGSLVAYPASRPRPAISSLIWYGGSQKHAVGLVTGLSPSRELKVYATAGSTHFMVDVLGYYR